MINTSNIDDFDAQPPRSVQPGGSQGESEAVSLTKASGGFTPRERMDAMTDDQKFTSLLDEQPLDMSPEEADQEMEKFFDQLKEELKDVPETVIQDGAQKMVDFLKGDVSWSEILNLTPETMQRIAEFGYMQLQSGRLEDAERFFKVLTMLNWNNPYFHSMLGLVYQRQDRPGEAIAQYSEAITLNPVDGVSLMNRASIYIRYGWLEDAEKDLALITSIDGHAEEEWGKNAIALKGRIAQIRKSRAEGSAKKSAKGTSKRK
jgi:predicted Zn-dependent protease